MDKTEPASEAKERTNYKFSKGMGSLITLGCIFILMGVVSIFLGLRLSQIHPDNGVESRFYYSNNQLWFAVYVWSKGDIIDHWSVCQDNVKEPIIVNDNVQRVPYITQEMYNDMLRKAEKRFQEIK